MMRWLSVAVVAFSLGLAACAGPTGKKVSRWDAYYARTDTPRAYVEVVPPEGTTVPMAKLIAQYVADHLKQEKISAQIGDGKQANARHFVLTGMAEANKAEPRAKYSRILRWMLSDGNGRLISTYSLGIEGTEREWDFGDPQLLASIGIGTAGPVSQMVLKEVKATVPIDPLRRGLLVEQVTGLSSDDARHLTQAVAVALRTSDVLVTGDPRQASFRLAGHVEMSNVEGGFVDVRIVWRVLTMDRRELGSAVQENRLPADTVLRRWADISPSIGKAAAVGVEHVFGTRVGPPPGAPTRATGEPPAIVLPGEPGRAMPPPM
ncbi:hypothetical protein [Magnetovibrio sp.]|uniref:hypothetical protein n=1 Tax=Magnetovibrio sp. TaxID=2024836 RepID=UPI002F932F55